MVLIVRGKNAENGLGFSPHGAGRNFSRTNKVGTVRWTPLYRSVNIKGATTAVPTFSGGGGGTVTPCRMLSAARSRSASPDDRVSRTEVTLPEALTTKVTFAVPTARRDLAALG